MREDARRLLDELPEEELPFLLRILRGLRPDSMSAVPEWLADAPVDDEPLSDEALVKIAEAESDIAAGRVISSLEAKRRLLG